MNESLSVSVERLSVVRGGKAHLSDISISVPQGSWVSIIGANGAGKSTLLQALIGIVEHTGKVSLGGMRLDQLSQRKRASHIAYVPQRLDASVPFSVEEFLRFALYARNLVGKDDLLEPLYDLFRLSEFRQRSIQELSVGEFQRVSLAAAVAQQSEILLLDEPSSALDPYEELQAILSMRAVKEREGRTIFFVSHNLSHALTHADTVIALKNGKITFCGSPQLLVEKNILSDIFACPFIVERRGDGWFVIVDTASRGTHHS